MVLKHPVADDVFVDAMQIGATATQSDPKESVDPRERWSAPECQLRNVRRLANTLTHIDEVCQSAHDPRHPARRRVEYHGAFSTRRFEIKLWWIPGKLRRYPMHRSRAITVHQPRRSRGGRCPHRRADRVPHAPPRTPAPTLDAQVLGSTRTWRVRPCSPQATQLCTSLRAELSASSTTCSSPRLVWHSSRSS